MRSRSTSSWRTTPRRRAEPLSPAAATEPTAGVGTFRPRPLSLPCPAERRPAHDPRWPRQLRCLVVRARRVAGRRARRTRRPPRRVAHQATRVRAASRLAARVSKVATREAARQELGAQAGQPGGRSPGGRRHGAGWRAALVCASAPRRARLTVANFEISCISRLNIDTRFDANFPQRV